MNPLKERYNALAQKRDELNKQLQYLARLPQDGWVEEDAELLRQRLVRIETEMRRCVNRREQRELKKSTMPLWWTARRNEKHLQEARRG